MLKIKKPNIVATLLAKNEEDIIGENIRHHISEGVHTFIFTDNNSTDKTKEIVSQFPEVKVIIDEFDNNHNQRHWVTRMAKIACDFSPDWILHIDADEFWLLNNLAHETTNNILTTKNIYQHLPIGDLEYYVGNNLVNCMGLPPTMPKIIHRSDPNLIISNGNHKANLPHEEIQYRVSEIDIHHFPIKNYNDLLKKATIYASALFRQSGEAKSFAGTHWRQWNKLYEEGLLEAEFAKMQLISIDLINKGLAKKWTIPTKS